VGLTKISTTHFDWPTPKNPSSVQKSGTYLKSKLSYGEFCVKNFQIFVTVATGVV